MWRHQILTHPTRGAKNSKQDTARASALLLPWRQCQQQSQGRLQQKGWPWQCFSLPRSCPGHNQVQMPAWGSSRSWTCVWGTETTRAHTLLAWCMWHFCYIRAVLLRRKWEEIWNILRWSPVLTKWHFWGTAFTPPENLKQLPKTDEKACSHFSSNPTPASFWDVAFWCCCIK